MGNEFGGQASTSVGKNKTQTQCLMRCFNCTYLYSKQKLKTKQYQVERKGHNFSELEMSLLERVEKERASILPSDAVKDVKGMREKEVLIR